MAEVTSNKTLRRYVSEAEAIDKTGENSVSEEILNLAEEMIDAFVGRQDKHATFVFKGIATGGSVSTVVDTSGNSYLTERDDDYFTYCVVEILSGSAKGDLRHISASDRSAGSVTVDVDFSASVASGNAYIVYQLGKFPRNSDVFHDDTEAKYFKRIDRNVNRAVLAQIEYINEKGTEFLEAGATDKEGEGIGDYRYQKRKGAEDRISPAARLLLARIRNRTGRLIG